MRIEVTDCVAESCWLVNTLSEWHQNLSSLRVEVWLQTSTSIFFCFNICLCSLIITMWRVAVILGVCFIWFRVFSWNWDLGSFARTRIVSLHESRRLNWRMWLLIFITLPLLELIYFVWVLSLRIQLEIVVLVHEKLRLSYLLRRGLSWERWLTWILLPIELGVFVVWVLHLLICKFDCLII